MRIGQGFDLHRLVPGRKLILGGVEVDYHLGLLGHSDADVLAHALADAVLGAAGLGDIGRLFPDTDPELAGISSLKILSAIGRRLDEAGLRLLNGDLTLIAQAPKIAHLAGEMGRRMATALGAGVGAVSVKAKTAEGLGLIGQGQAMAALAVALVGEK